MNEKKSKVYLGNGKVVHLQKLIMYKEKDPE